MWAAKLKLGFMTSYTWTVFIRRERIDDEWVLFFSDTIHHTAKSKMGASDTSVSVRECMLYYFQLAAGERSNWSLENEQQEPLQDWVIIKERNPSSRPNATTPTTYFPQQVHRIPSGASLGPPTPTTSKTMQLPQRPRHSGRGQSESDSTDAKRAEYRDFGEVSIYGKFYKFTLDGKLSMKDRDYGSGQ